ncbi:ABC transporter substrate-binding protein [Rhodoferax sp.]|uniref:ABC transporter substrate-binding protein n=1 Tax=Rhodoferax sp. TaxID=50421 RepID=UPI00271F7BAD|nr:ABC transporter substrate-binding protein [Rhodoferax sp.]MDO9195144.1 ABC transporter substrate-binding protein [Rhodoferax sp.]
MVRSPIPTRSSDIAQDRGSIGVATRRAAIAAMLAATQPGWLTACSRSNPLRIAGHPWPGYEPLFYAKSQGLLPAGLDLQEMPTVTASINALKEGRTDGAMLTLDEALVLQARGMALEVVLVFDASKGADVLLARKELQGLEQLRGKIIGLEPSTLGELMLAMILEKAGLSRADVTTRYIAFEEQEAAWAGSQLDALITYEPVASRLAGSARQMLTTRQMPDIIFDVLAIKTDAAHSHAEILRQTLKAHFQTLEQLRRNPWDTAYRMAPHLGIPAEELINSLRGLELLDLVANRSYLARKDGHMVDVARRLSVIMQAAGALSAPAQVETLFNDAYLPGDAS